MRGTVYRRKSDGRWVGSVDLGFDTNGKRKRRVIYGNSEKEAQRKINEILFAVQTGEYITPAKDTFINFLIEYHCSSAGYDMWKCDDMHPIKAKWEPTTSALYKMYIDVHFMPYFKDMKLIDIRPMHLEKFYNYKMNSNRGDVAPLSNNTVRKFNAFFKAAFNYAIKNGIINKNPAVNIDFGVKDKYQPVIYNEEQFRYLLDSVSGSDDEIPILLAGACGFRRGEIFGLYWRDIDLKKRTVSIKQTDVRFDKYVEKRPKTVTSSRTLKIPEYVVFVLDDYIKKNGGYALNKDQKVITKWKPDSYSKHFTKLLSDLKMPHIRLHDLRHYNAVIMCKYGVSDKVAAERLGHSTVATLREVYQHVLADMDESASNEINEMLTRPNNKSNFKIV